MPVKFSPEERDEIIRKWVRLTPSERAPFAAERGFDGSLVSYWKKAGLWPKDVTTPPPAKPDTGEVVPRADGIYTGSERVLIRAQWEEARKSVIDAEGNRGQVDLAGNLVVAKYGESIKKWLNHPQAIDKDIVPPANGRRTYNDAERAAIVAKIEASGKPIKEACEDAGTHFTNYYAWRKHLKDGKPIGKKATGKPKGAPGPGKRSPIGEKIYTDAQRRDIYQKVQADVKQSHRSIGAACKHLGIAPSTYFECRNLVLKGDASYSRLRATVEKAPSSKPVEIPTPAKLRKMHARAKSALSQDVKRAIVDKIENAKGNASSRAERYGLSFSTCCSWKRELGLMGPAKSRASKRPKGDLVLVANRALARANGDPVPPLPTKSPRPAVDSVGQLLAAALHELRERGTEVTSISLDPDGSAYLITYKRTERVEI